MKVHLNEFEGRNPMDNNTTVCGGRVSGTKSTGKNQYFAVDTVDFIKVQLKDRCKKCQTTFEASTKTK